MRRVHNNRFHGIAFSTAAAATTAVSTCIKRRFGCDCEGHQIAVHVAAAPKRVQMPIIANQGKCVAHKRRAKIGSPSYGVRSMKAGRSKDVASGGEGACQDVKSGLNNFLQDDDVG